MTNDVVAAGARPLKPELSAPMQAIYAAIGEEGSPLTIPGHIRDKAIVLRDQAIAAYGPGAHPITEAAVADYLKKISLAFMSNRPDKEALEATIPVYCFMLREAPRWVLGAELLDKLIRGKFFPSPGDLVEAVDEIMKPYRRHLRALRLLAAMPAEKVEERRLPPTPEQIAEVHKTLAAINSKYRTRRDDGEEIEA